MSANKQLAGLLFENVRAKADKGLALNLREVAIVTGYGYRQVRDWNLPLLSGKITWTEFIAWKASRLVLAQGQQTAPHPESIPADKSGAPRSRHGSPASSSRVRGSRLSRLLR